MGIRVIEGIEGACLYDSVTMWAFGPIFDSEEQAEAFLEFVQRKDVPDLRKLKDKQVMDLFDAFLGANASVAPDKDT